MKIAFSHRRRLSLWWSNKLRCLMCTRRYRVETSWECQQTCYGKCGREELLDVHVQHGHDCRKSMDSFMLRTIFNLYQQAPPFPPPNTIFEMGSHSIQSLSVCVWTSVTQSLLIMQGSQGPVGYLTQRSCATRWIRAWTHVLVPVRGLAWAT